MLLFFRCVHASLMIYHSLFIRIWSYEEDVTFSRLELEGLERVRLTLGKVSLQLQGHRAGAPLEKEVIWG